MSPRALWPIAGITTLLVLWNVTRVAARRRLFTNAQRDLIGWAFGANCVFRRTHGFPMVVAYLLLEQLLAGDLRAAFTIPDWAPGRPSTIAVLITQHQLAIALRFAILATGLGLPMTRTVLRCAGTMQGGHQWAASRLGTTSILNGEPCCRAHNGDQSAEWSKAYIARQLPWSLPVYLCRDVLGTGLLIGRLIVDPKARRKARAR